MSDLQQYSWNLNLIKTVEDNIVFLLKKKIILKYFLEARYAKKPQIKKQSSNSYLSRQSFFKGIVVNRTVESLKKYDLQMEWFFSQGIIDHKDYH